MGKRILVIQGHPEPEARRLCHVLADHYVEGAQTAGHEVRRVELAALDFPLLRSQADWEKGLLPASLVQAQQDIAWAQHLVLVFPLWLGDMPALLKGFLEQVARPGFAFKAEGGNPFGRKGLKGRSARIVCTMGMPAPAVPLLLHGAQHQVPGAQHPRLRRHCAGARDLGRHGGEPGRRGRGEALRQVEGVGAQGGLRATFRD
ncbi:NAD(P)H-dependent oxidoreductase [Pelomonas sp. V22]|uniref:NAD(P)H-dependent oxidoreductase n=1 Tax=Pelomonas sp. V22 TaxID=2822139 RepID=UPI0032C194A5